MIKSLIKCVEERAQETGKNFLKQGTINSQGAFHQGINWFISQLTKEIDNDAEVNMCCLGSVHPCPFNVNDGHCTGVSCQYKVRKGPI